MATERQEKQARERARQLVEKKKCVGCNEEKLLKDFPCYSLNRGKYDSRCFDCCRYAQIIADLVKIKTRLNADHFIDPSSCNLIATCSECKRLMHDKRTERMNTFFTFGKRERTPSYRHNYVEDPRMCDDCAKNLANFCTIAKCDWCHKLKPGRNVFNVHLSHMEPVIVDEEGRIIGEYDYEEYGRFMERTPETICFSCNSKFNGLYRRQRSCEDIFNVIKNLQKEIRHAKANQNNG